MNILLIVYKIEKGKGSEDGSGYHIARELVKRFPGLTLISRQNNIDKLTTDPDFSTAKLIGVDVPKAIGFFKRKSFGITLYYYLWQLTVGYKIRQLQKQQRYDAIHLLNFHATWAPHFIFSKNAKIVWGPLTHHPMVPYALWEEGLLAYGKEILKAGIKRLFWFLDPFLLWAVRRSHRIFLGHGDIVYPYATASGKLALLPQAGSVFATVTEKSRNEVFNILFIGRFVSLKGVTLALEAVKQMTENCHLTVIGEGPLDTKISHVRFLPWQDQQALQQHYRQADLFLFPSLEGQGLVVAEALAHGCPVLCLEGTGPETVAGPAAITVRLEKKQEIINNLGLKLNELAREYRSDPVAWEKRIQQALARSAELSWSRKADLIAESYHD